MYCLFKKTYIKNETEANMGGHLGKQLTNDKYTFIQKWG